MTCTCFSTFYPFGRMKVPSLETQQQYSRRFYPPKSITRAKACASVQVIAVRQKYLENLLVILGLFWRFLEEAFSRKSLTISKRRGRFQSGKFQIIFEHVNHYIMYLSILSFWYPGSSGLSNGDCFFLTHPVGSISISLCSQLISLPANSSVLSILWYW